MTNPVPFRQQISALERLINLGPDALRKGGARLSEVEMIITQAKAALNTLYRIEPHQDAVRELLRSKVGGA